MSTTEERIRGAIARALRVDRRHIRFDAFATDQQGRPGAWCLGDTPVAERVVDDAIALASEGPEWDERGHPLDEQEILGW